MRAVLRYKADPVEPLEDPPQVIDLPSAGHREPHASRLQSPDDIEYFHRRLAPAVKQCPVEVCHY